jgi:hypothetical protein
MLKNTYLVAKTSLAPLKRRLFWGGKRAAVMKTFFSTDPKRFTAIQLLSSEYL